MFHFSIKYTDPLCGWRGRERESKQARQGKQSGTRGNRKAAWHEEKEGEREEEEEEGGNPLSLPPSNLPPAVAQQARPPPCSAMLLPEAHGIAEREGLHCMNVSEFHYATVQAG